MTDGDMARAEDLLAVARYAEALSDPETATEAIWRWNEALYDHGIIDHDYGGMPLRDARRLVEAAALDLASISTADLRSVRAMATFLSRAERFCDGWLHQAAENGVAAALSVRLGELGCLLEDTNKSAS